MQEHLNFISIAHQPLSFHTAGSLKLNLGNRRGLKVKVNKLRSEQQTN